MEAKDSRPINFESVLAHSKVPQLSSVCCVILSHPRHNACIFIGKSSGLINHPPPFSGFVPSLLARLLTCVWCLSRFFHGSLGDGAIGGRDSDSV